MTWLLLGYMAGIGTVPAMVFIHNCRLRARRNAAIRRWRRNQSYNIVCSRSDVWDPKNWGLR